MGVQGRDSLNTNMGRGGGGGGGWSDACSMFGQRRRHIALRRFLHNHGNIATEGSPKPGLCPTLISNDFKGSL